jgi:Tfp pilus assembly protein PilW
MKHFSTQRGLSLIGLLIGLLISVLCILASLTLYKSLIRVATESKLDSMHDGQLAAAALVIQMEVQSAGYGITGADADDILVRIPATGERQLLWRYTLDNGTTFECRGLHESSMTESNGDKYRVLRVIKASSGCNGTVALGTLNWNTQLSVLGRWREFDDGVADQGLDKYLSTNSTLFSFSVPSTPVACNTTYGAIASPTVNHLQLRVTAPSSANLQGAAGLPVNTYDFCLPNTYPI